MIPSFLAHRVAGLFEGEDARQQPHPSFLKRRGLFPNWTSPGRVSYAKKTTGTELLLENRDTKPRFGISADVSSSEEGTADTVPGDLTTIDWHSPQRQRRRC